jgi:transposase
MAVVKDHQQREPSMGDITAISLDLAKNVFQVHAVDRAGNVVVRKRIRRGQVLGGPIVATAIAATIADPNTFRSGREFAAWLGLVPRQNSTGSKARLSGISKRGDSYLRRLLVNSAHTVLLCSKTAKNDPWLISLLGRKPRLVAAVALANKTARVAWAIMSRHDTCRRSSGRVTC